MSNTIHTQVVRIGVGPGEATEPISESNPLPVSGSITLDSGTKVTAVADLGAGGSGTIGWLSAATDLLSQIWTAVTGVLRVEPLGRPTLAWQLAASGAGSEQVLSLTVTRITIYARDCDQRFLVGTGTLTVSSTASHFLPMGRSMDIAVEAGSKIAVKRDSAAIQDGVLEVSELV